MISRECLYNTLVYYGKNRQGKYTFLLQVSEKEEKKIEILRMIKTVTIFLPPLPKAFKRTFQ